MYWNLNFNVTLYAVNKSEKRTVWLKKEENVLGYLRFILLDFISSQLTA